MISRIFKHLSNGVTGQGLVTQVRGLLKVFNESQVGGMITEGIKLMEKKDISCTEKHG